MSDVLTFPVDVVQFLLPTGKRKQMITDLPVECRDLYNDMRRQGCGFESEILRTGEVSVTITSADEDLDNVICSNGPQVQQGLVDMLKRKRWLEHDYESELR